MELFFSAFMSLMNPSTLLLVLSGVFLGIVFGALPGLNTSMAVCLCLPLTFVLNHIDGIAMIVGVFIGGVSGGLISAILLNIPGTAAAMATCFDGHPMVKKGQAGRAMGIGIFYSFMGTIIGMIALITISRPLASVALHFTSVEYFSIYVFALTMMASLSGKSLARGLIAGFLGVFIACIGTAPIDYTPRFAFGSNNLAAGFSLVAVLTGTFAISTVMKSIQNPTDVKTSDFGKAKMHGFGFTIKEFVRQIWNMIRSGVIGVGIGILPGIGASTSNLMAYSVAKSSSKYPEKFGTGIMDGIVASETANNATVCGAMIPLLTLGIPGDIGTAFLLSALQIHGISPGPLLFDTNPDLVYVCFAAIGVSVVFMVLLEFFGIRLFTKVLTIREYILLPVIIVLCAVGAFANNNRTFDVIFLVVFGLLGYFLNRWGYPLGPLCIGFILGPSTETSLRRALMASDTGNIITSLISPIAIVFYIIAVLSVVMSIRNNKRLNRKLAEAAARGEDVKETNV